MRIIKTTMSALIKSVFISAFLLNSSSGFAATYFYHNDHLGTPQALSDSDQQIAWEVNQKPFGDSEATTNSVVQSIRFPGQYADVETGLSYNYFRTYDTSIGRYTQSDPLGLSGGLSTFGYTVNNPLVGVDPFGLITCVLVSRGELGLPGYNSQAKGSHATVWASAGGSGGGPWAYDPAGSYGGAERPTNDLFDAAWAADTGGTYRPGDFSNYATNGGHSIEIVCKDTTPEKEQEMYEAAKSNGPGSGMYCAADVSTVITGKPGFENVEKPTWMIPKFPVTLIDEVKKSPFPSSSSRQ